MTIPKRRSEQATCSALVQAARDALMGNVGDHPLERLAGGLRHQVLEDSDLAPGMVVKVFSGTEIGLARAEWIALTRLKDSGFTPRPICFDPVPPLPAIVMSKVPGEARTLQELDEDSFLSMSRIHSWFHQQKGVTENLALNHPERMLRDARRLLNDRKTTMTTEGPQSQAIIAAQQWIWSSEPQELVESSVLVFCRGDTNVTNYLWQGVSVSVVDFEESGLNDPVFEVADCIEHPLRHDLPGWAGTLLARAACLDRRSRKSLEVGRRLAACYWLAVLLRLRGTDTEQRLGVSIARQADRVAERLNV